MIHDIYQQIQQDFEAPVIDNYPILDPSLCWTDDIYVLGCNAALEIGPGCLNLMGAMRGAKLVAETLHDLMWYSKPANTELNGNLFAAFMSSEEEEDDDDDDTASSTSEFAPQ